MKIIRSESPPITRKQAAARTLPYYNRVEGERLWEHIRRWRVSGHLARVSWNHVTLKINVNTLKAKLENPRKWLEEQGTPEQRELAHQVYFAKQGNEYILTFRRLTGDVLGQATVSAEEPAPAQAPDDESYDSLYSDVRNGLMDFLQTAEYDGVDANARPAYVRTGFVLSELQAASLRALVESAGDGFFCKISPGRHATIRVAALSPEEVKGRAT